MAANLGEENMLVLYSIVAGIRRALFSAHRTLRLASACDFGLVEKTLSADKQDKFHRDGVLYSYVADCPWGRHPLRQRGRLAPSFDTRQRPSQMARGNNAANPSQAQEA